MPGFSAVMFITHDVDLAVIYANRVLLMADGRLVADGRPADVLSDFAQLEACHLVPSSLLAMNVERFPQTGSVPEGGVIGPSFNLEESRNGKSAH